MAQQAMTTTDLQQLSNGAASLIAGYEAVEDELKSSSPAWLNALRVGGADEFRVTGLPGPKAEAWKYTRLNVLETAEFLPVEDVQGFDAAKLPAPLLGESGTLGRLVFVNGVYQAELSTPVEGLAVESLETLVRDDPDHAETYLGGLKNEAESPLARLNDAYIHDGYAVYVRKNTRIETPVEILFYGSGGTENTVVYHPRNLIVVEDGAQATLLERHVGHADYFANSMTEIYVGDNARLHHYRHQDESRDATHIATTALRVGRDAYYDGYTLTTGAGLSRNELTAVLDGAGSDCHTNGAYLLDGAQHCDTTILMDHRQPHCRSNQNYKGVIDDSARGVFQGKIHVHRPAQKTDGYQLNNALLLSDRAEIDTKPELEIYADDVKCSHGATAGQLDEGPLFYLQSRGLSRDQARAMLIEAFVGESLEDIDDENVREAFREIIGNWLREGHV